MKIQKIAEGAYFVKSYSEQTIAPAYDESLSLQSLGFGTETDDQKPRDEDKTIDLISS